MSNKNIVKGKNIKGISSSSFLYILLQNVFNLQVKEILELIKILTVNELLQKKKETNYQIINQEKCENAPPSP